MNNDTNKAVQESATSIPEAIAEGKRKKGIIKRFCELNLSALEKMRDDLSLSMNSRELAKCQSVYRLLKRDEISTDEIYFLDRFIASRRNLGSMLAPREILTNKSYIADTYADMMDKCTQLDILGASPISINLNALFEVGSEYAKFAGRSGGFFASEDIGKYSNVIGESGVSIAPASKKEPISVKNSACPLTCFINSDSFEGFQTKRVKNKKASIAFLLSPDKSVPQNEKIASFLAEESCKKSLIAYGSVEDALTRSLHKFCGHLGVNIYLDSLADFDISNIYEIEERFIGLPLICYASNAESELQKLAETMEMKLVSFAAIQKIHNLTVVKSGAAVFNMPWGYLSSLLPAKAMVAKINGDSSDIKRLSINSSTAYSVSSARDDTVDIGKNFFVSSAYTKLDCGYFSTLYALLGAISKLIAKGVSPSDISVSYKMNAKYPESEEEFGNLLSYILGAYRAHAELALVGSKCTLSLSDENDGFIAFAFGNVKDTAISNRLSDFSRSYTYIAEPTLDENGIINFDSLRDIWRFISESKRDIVAAKVLCSESVCGLTDKKTPLAFIIQTLEEVDVPHSTATSSEVIT